jgi:hypothetical protein
MADLTVVMVRLGQEGVKLAAGIAILRVIARSWFDKPVLSFVEGLTMMVRQAHHERTPLTLRACDFLTSQALSIWCGYGRE